MAEQRCFDNNTAQLIHKYSFYVLTLLIGALSWWLLNIDVRLTKESDARTASQINQAALQANQMSISTQLLDIKGQLDKIEQRLFNTIDRENNYKKYRELQ